MKVRGDFKNAFGEVPILYSRTSLEEMKAQMNIVVGNSTAEFTNPITKKRVQMERSHIVPNFFDVLAEHYLKQVKGSALNGMGDIYMSDIEEHFDLNPEDPYLYLGEENVVDIQNDFDTKASTVLSKATITTAVNQAISEKQETAATNGNKKKALALAGGVALVSYLLLRE